MRLHQLSVQNYRGLRDVTLPLSRFGCFIGKNNAGKSSILQAVSLFFSGTALKAKDFFDPSLPIRIEVCFEEITEGDLDRLSITHRSKIEALISNGRLTLVCRYEAPGSGKLMYVARVPKEVRFRADKVSDLISGKKGSELLSVFVEAFPELQGKFTASSINIGKAKEEIEALGNALPDSEKEFVDTALTTGIPESVKKFLPEPIYIPAVKNLADDVKAKESTPFGKILGILLEAIEPKLPDVKTFFADLSKKFNRIVREDGSISDERLPEVKKIESTVESYLRESFANVTLEINVPPPELKTILSSAEVLIDDGVKGGIENKGDGLRRAAVFAILRSYVSLDQPGAMNAEQDSTLSDRHVLLFEEPELYLHPAAQKILFDALGIFAKKNHVLISTHSPAFFGPDRTASFIKLNKVFEPAVSKTPFTTVHPVDLGDVKTKDQFQLICFENNNAGFFFDSVILVEGDSDYIVLPHVASLVTPNWSSQGSLHKFIRINGKSSVKRYKEFFSRFNVRVAVVTDLDLLTDGFDTIQPCDQLIACRDKLLELVDKEIQDGAGFRDASNKKIADAHGKTELYGRWKYAKQVWQEMQGGTRTMEQLVEAVDSFFAWEKSFQRLMVLQECKKPEIIKSKRGLLSKLREVDVYVLERGALEAYYPAVIKKADKPTMAQEFCKHIASKEAALALCDHHCDDDGKVLGREFEIICSGLFGYKLEEPDV